jgi:thiol-disulfide isomerase/thioredoxin
MVLGLVLSSSVGAANKPAAAARPSPAIGDPIANLTFKDIHYLPRSLNDFPDAKAFVLTFTTTTCPVVQRYLPVMKQMERDYRNKGVQFLAVNVGPDDSIVMVATQAVKHEMEFPFVKDFDCKCASAMGVRRTPEVVVLDKERRIRYRGRIDDQYRLGGTKASAGRRDLQEAIDSVLAGREVAVKETPVDGCPITWPAEEELRGQKSEVKKRVTWGENVAKIVQKNCQECHRPGTAAPFSLITYKDVASRADAIAEVVAEGRMPPWYASDEYGHFINRRALNPDDREAILQWVRTGKERGPESLSAQAEEKQKPPVAEGGWLIGKPDLVVSAPQHNLPAAGDIPYKYVTLPMQLPEDLWVRRVQILPDNRRTVHHCNMFYKDPADGYKDIHFVTGTVPGSSPMFLDDGIGFRFPKNAVVMLQIHYVSTGKPEKCRISAGFQYARGVVQRQLRHKLMVDNKFAIPPGAPAHPVSGSKVLEHDAEGIALFVHMHVRGRDMTFLAHRPDGTTETLLMVPNYSFDWQMPYRWEPGTKIFPKGTRMEALAHYDNSTFNPYNPDPKATVRDGQQTHEEMLNGFFFYTEANEKLNLEIDPATGHAKKK